MSKLSVIVPAYNEEKTIYQGLLNLDNVLNEINRPYEIVVISDGSQDNTYIEALKYKSDKVKVFHYNQNKGKGFAIKYGFYKTNGEIVGFIDADLDLNPKGIKNLLQYMEEEKADIVVGSKRHPQSKVVYPPRRQLYSGTYQLFIKLLFNLNIKDTQVGLKLFRREVLQKVLPVILVKRYAFDLETLVVASYFGYKNICEAPIELNHQFTSSIDVKEVKNIIQDTCAIFYRLKILKYYDKKK
jgi:glycosyltransferase involved in cell wall biosynthesis